jgi:hypothetical protein
MKTIVEPSLHENLLTKKMRKPQLIERRPTFSNTSERYMMNCMNLNLMKIEDKTKDEKAIEKKNNVEEI